MVKFRVWNTTQLRFDNDSDFVLTSEGKLIQLRTHDFQPQDTFTIHQWTGISDRNGKEIYEGDICLGHMAERPMSTSRREKPVYFHITKRVDPCHGFEFSMDQLTIIPKGDYRTYPYMNELEVISHEFAFPIRQVLNKEFVAPQELGFKTIPSHDTPALC